MEDISKAAGETGKGVVKLVKTLVVTILPTAVTILLLDYTMRKWNWGWHKTA